MHGFAHMMGSVFGHKWAAIVLKQCQKLVTVTKASHKLRFWLRTEMDLLKLSDPVLYKDLTWLVTIATTHFVDIQLHAVSVALTAGIPEHVAEASG